MARFALIIVMGISTIGLILVISYLDIFDYLIGVIEMLIYGFFLIYWIKKEHSKFLIS